MNTDEERQRAVAAIDAQIATLIEDGVPTDGSRIRALRAKRAVAQKSKKAIKRSVREARDRQAASAAAASSAKGRSAKQVGGRVALAPDSAADTKRLQSLSDKDRKRIELARTEVRRSLKYCGEPSTKAVRNAIAECDATISDLINQGQRYESKTRRRLRSRKARLKELEGALALRRRKSAPSELELAFLLDAYLHRRRQIRRGPDNVVGVLDVRSGGAPSLGKRK